MTRRLSLLFLLCLGVYSTQAQSGYGPMGGYVREKSSDVADGAASTGRGKDLPGAVVEVFTPADTLHATTDLNGEFYFTRVPAGLVRVRISYLGYETFTQDSVRIVERFGIRYPLSVELTPQSKRIDEVVIEGQARLMTRSGDTIIYNAAAVRTMAGDEAIRILEQMPGITLDEAGSITVLGERLARTYVNGRLLFGDEPATALNNLLASEVVKMKVYSEPTDEARRRGLKRGDMQRVLDIRTREPIVAVINGHFLASYGADFERTDQSRQQRYGIGATGNFFSEKLLLAVNAYSNNIGRTSNRLQDLLKINKADNNYSERHYANLNVSKLWGPNRFEGQLLEAGYSYDDQYSRTGSRSMRNYFATEADPARIYADTSASRSVFGRHDARLNLTLNPGKKNGLVFLNDFTCATPRHWSEQRIANRSASHEQRTAVLQREEGHEYELHNRLNWWYHPSEKFSLTVGLASQIGENDRSGVWIDTLSLNKRTLESDYRGPRRKLSGEIEFHQQLRNDERMTITLKQSYGLEWEKHTKSKTSLNTYDPVPAIDPANTYDYTYDYTTHRAGLSLDLFSSIFSIDVRLNIESARLNRSERYPEGVRYGQRFTSVLPALTCSFFRNASSFDIFSYKATVSLPGIEQLRARINDSNPLLLQGGNPGLKQSIGHLISLTYPVWLDSGKKGTIRLSLNATWHTNDIAPHSRYFAHETRLDEWDYTAPAGSTLTTWENMSGAFDMRFYCDYQRRIKPIRTNLSIGIRYDFERQPSFVGEQKNLLFRHTPALSLLLSGTQSRHLRLRLQSTTGYVFARNIIGSDSRYLRQTAVASAEIRFLKHLFVNTHYTLTCYRFFSNTGRNSTTHLLNAALGYELPGKTGSLSVSAFDLLNRGTGVTATTFADYELQRWQPSFGRYFTVNIAVKFNKSRKAATAPGIVNDGGRHDAYDLGK